MSVILAKQEQKTINLTCCMSTSYNANLIVQINYVFFRGEFNFKNAIIWIIYAYILFRMK